MLFGHFKFWVANLPAFKQKSVFYLDVLVGSQLLIIVNKNCKNFFWSDYKALNKTDKLYKLK